MNRRSFNFGAALIAAALFALGACDSSLPPAATDAAGGPDSSNGQLDGAGKTDGDQTDGDTTKPDGDTTRPDGNTTKPDGNTTKPDGNTTKPDGNTNHPDGAVSLCGKEGQVIKLGGKCCTGLTPGSIGKPPSCITIGQSFICVRCGDGKCDASKGENGCSCPRDCKANTTECETKGGYCTIQFTKCKKGYQSDSKLSCGGALSLSCCMPAKCVGVLCPAPTCSMAKTGVCTSTSSKCSPTTGTCGKSSSSITPSCKMNGTSCVQFTPKCSGTSCATTSQATSQTCKQVKTSCVQSVPSCASNQCSTRTATIAKSTCNTLTGSCVRLLGCKTNCDCSQGLMCANGRCIAGIMPVYCCSKPGCPTGKTCTNPNGTTGICPAVTTECATKKGICVVQFSICPKGYVLDTKTGCGPVRSLQCCLPRP